jgi:hypothetical protein
MQVSIVLRVTPTSWPRKSVPKITWLQPHVYDIRRPQTSVRMPDLRHPYYDLGAM